MKRLNENDQSVRTVSGFQEFTKNGKESICEEDKLKTKKIFLRKKKDQ